MRASLCPPARLWLAGAGIFGVVSILFGSAVTGQLTDGPTGPVRGTPGASFYLSIVAVALIVVARLAVVRTDRHDMVLIGPPKPSPVVEAPAGVPAQVDVAAQQWANADAIANAMGSGPASRTSGGPGSSGVSAGQGSGAASMRRQP